MATKKNYSDFIQFAHEHTNLNYNQLETLYREQGGKIKRATGQELIRKEFGFDKGEMRGKPIGAKLTSKAEHYEYIPETKTPKKEKVKKEKPLKVKTSGGKRDSIKFKIQDKKQSKYISRKSPAVKKLELNIKKLYGEKSDTYIKIGLIIGDDGYTKLNKFSVLYPFDFKEKQGIKVTGKNMINNLKTYYANLAKMYKGNNGTSFLKNTMMDKLNNLNKDLNKARGLNKQGLIDLFQRYGIEITDFELLTFKD